MSLDYARAIQTWQYHPPYDWYNAAPDPDTITSVFLNPEFHYYVVLNQAGTLVAFRCFGADAQVGGGDYSLEALDMGGGLHPAYLGQGWGAYVMKAAMDFARSQFAPRRFRATVAAWNHRAFKACRKAGYHEHARFISNSGIEFVQLLRDA